jgi:glycogen operon protein
MAVFLNGHAISEPGPHGEQVTDDDFLLLVNAHSDPVTFRMPGSQFAARWQVMISSAGEAGGQLGPASAMEVPGHAMMVLRGSRADQTTPPGSD